MSPLSKTVSSIVELQHYTYNNKMSLTLPSRMMHLWRRIDSRKDSNNFLKTTRSFHDGLARHYRYPYSEFYRLPQPAPSLDPSQYS